MSTKDAHLFTAVILLVLIGIIGSTREGTLTGMAAYTPAGAPPSQLALPPVMPAQDQGTTLEHAIQFLQAFGFFRVVLPFLLIFTIVFGVLEKTKIFGTEKFKNEEVPRRNLNSVVSFCIAFFVVAASNVVDLLQTSLPMVALLLVVIIVFLLLFGSLMGKEQLDKGMNLWAGGFKPTFVTVITIVVLAILLAGFGLLDDLFALVGANLTGTFITSLFLLVIVVGSIWFVAGKRGESESSGEKKT